MLNGEVWATFWNISRPFFHRRQGNDMDWASVGPGNKKATVTLSNVVVIKGTRNRELAHLYLNRALDPGVQYGMLKWGGYGPVTEEARQAILKDPDPNVKRIAEVPWKDAFTIDLEPDLGVAAKSMGDWVDQFDRMAGTKKG